MLTKDLQITSNSITKAVGLNPMSLQCSMVMICYKQASLTKHSLHSNNLDNIFAIEGNIVATNPESPSQLLSSEFLACFLTLCLSATYKKHQDMRRHDMTHVASLTCCQRTTRLCRNKCSCSWSNKSPNTTLPHTQFMLHSDCAQ